MTAAEQSLGTTRQLLYEQAGWRVPPKQVERNAKALGRAIAENEQALVETELRTTPTVSIGLDGTRVPVCKGLGRRASGPATRPLGQDVRGLTGGGLDGRIVPFGMPPATGCRLGQLCDRDLMRGQWRHRFRGGALRPPSLAGGRAPEPGGGFPPDGAGKRGSQDLVARFRRTAHGHLGRGSVAREGASLGGRAGPSSRRGSAESMGARPVQRVRTEVRSVFPAGSALAESPSAETARQLPGQGLARFKASRVPSRRHEGRIFPAGFMSTKW